MQRNKRLEDKVLYQILFKNEILEACDITEKERLILQKRWNDENNFHQIGADLNLSTERVAFLYNKTLSKIEKNLFACCKSHIQSKYQFTDKLYIENEIPLSTPINLVTAFSPKCKAELFRNSIYTLSDLSNYDEKALLSFKNFGKQTIQIIQTVLKKAV